MASDESVPWDQRRKVIEDSVRAILRAIGEEPTREGLRETPARVARFWQEWMSFNDEIGGIAFKSDNLDELVAVGGLHLWSICEHHLLPFSMTVAVGYIAPGRVIGLSKIARIAQAHAHTLTMQERFAFDVATNLQVLLEIEDVAVVARGEHTCLAMRGIRTPGVMHTSVMLGRFRERPELRAEFLSLIEGR